MTDRSADMRHILSQIALTTGGTVLESPSDSPAARMISDIKALSLPARISVYRLSDDTVEATDLESTTRGIGQGRATMAALLAAADRYGVTIEIEPVYDNGIDDGLDQDVLCAWYRRLGFKMIPNRDPDEDREQDRYWVRTPRRSAVTETAALTERRVQVWSGATINVVKNPSPEVFHAMAEKGSLRGLLSPDGRTVLLWPGHMAIHSNIMQELGLGDYDCVLFAGKRWNGPVSDPMGDGYLPAIERLTPKPRTSPKEMADLYAQLMADPEFAAMVGEPQKD